MMRSALALFAGLALGAAVGVLFFGGLHMTVARLSHTRHPALLALGSMTLRLFAAAAGFFIAARTGLPAILAALVGFIAVRAFAVHAWGPGGRDTRRSTERIDAADAR